MIIEKKTDAQLVRIIRESADDEQAQAAFEELSSRRRFRSQQDDTQSIEYNGFDKPGDY